LKTVTVAAVMDVPEKVKLSCLTSRHEVKGLLKSTLRASAGPA
jgi:hypothetical protein